METTVATRENLEEQLEKLRAEPIVALDTETSGLDRFRGAKLVGIVAGTDQFAIYFPFGHLMSDNLPESAVGQIEEAVNEWVGHNAKFDYAMLRHQCGWTKAPKFCTMLATKALDFNQPAGLKALTERYLGEKQQEFSSLVDTASGQTMADLTPEQVSSYVFDDAKYTFLHYLRLRELVKESVVWQVFKVEIALIPALVEMEENGVAFDLTLAPKLREQFKLAVEKSDRSARRDLAKQLGCTGDKSTCQLQCKGGEELCTFALHSSQRLSRALFTQLEISAAGLSKTKTGVSTDAKTLKALVQRGHTWIQSILDYKEALRAVGMLDTYLDAVASDGRIHTSLLQYWVISGRLASSGPNMQQVPKTPPKGAELGIRNAMKARPGSRLVEIDYSQVELRVFAHLAGAKQLLEAFQAGEDIHRATAGIVFSKPVDQVSDKDRSTAKTVNFGLLYGQEERGLASTLSIPISEAERIMRAYHSKIPEIQRFKAVTIRDAERNGGVTTLLGRWIPLPDIESRNNFTRRKAQRLAVNARVQGGAADIMKVTLVRLHRHLQKYNGMVKMLLTVHDSVLLEVDNSLGDETIKEIEQVMTVDLGDVTLTVESKEGESWAQINEPPKKYDITINADLVPQGDNKALAEIIRNAKVEDGLSVALVTGGTRKELPWTVSPSIRAILRKIDPDQRWATVEH